MEKKPEIDKEIEEVIPREITDKYLKWLVGESEFEFELKVSVFLPLSVILVVSEFFSFIIESRKESIVSEFIFPICRSILISHPTNSTTSTTQIQSQYFTISIKTLSIQHYQTPYSNLIPSPHHPHIPFKRAGRPTPSLSKNRHHKTPPNKKQQSTTIQKQQKKTIQKQQSKKIHNNP